MYNNPTSYEAEDCGFKLHQDIRLIIEEAIVQLNSEPEIAGFAPDDFMTAATYIMQHLNNPIVTFNNVWEIFSRVKEEFENLFNKNG